MSTAAPAVPAHFGSTEDAAEGTESSSTSHCSRADPETTDTTAEQKPTEAKESMFAWGGRRKGATAIQLLRKNAVFRYLWLAAIVSRFGDWFYDIAIITLLQELSEGPQQMVILSAYMVTRRAVRSAVFPVAGVIADRFDRMTVMLVCDVLRMGLVLLFLFIRTPSHLWLLFALQCIQLTISAVFRPCQAALIPTVVDLDDLVAANILDNIADSLMQFAGAALGGLVTAAFGTAIDFLIDSLSFVLSGLLLLLMIYRRDGGFQALRYRLLAGLPRRCREREPALLQDEEEPARPAAMESSRARVREAGRPSGNVLVQLWAAIQYSWRHSDIIWLTMAKCLFNVPLAAFEMINIRFIRLEFTLGDSTGSLGLGLYNALSALGVLGGAFFADRFCSGTPGVIRSWLSAAVVLCVIGYALNAWSPMLWLFFLVTVPVAVGETWLYTFVSTLVQKNTLDEYRGRVSALSLSLRTLMSSLGSIGAGALLDHQLSLRATGSIFAAFEALIALLWLLVYLPVWRRFYARWLDTPHALLAVPDEPIEEEAGNAVALKTVDSGASTVDEPVPSEQTALADADVDADDRVRLERAAAVDLPAVRDRTPAAADDRGSESPPAVAARSPSSSTSTSFSARSADPGDSRLPVRAA